MPTKLTHYCQHCERLMDEESAQLHEMESPFCGMPDLIADMAEEDRPEIPEEDPS